MVGIYSIIRFPGATADKCFSVGGCDEKYFVHPHKFSPVDLWLSGVVTTCY